MPCFWYITPIIDLCGSTCIAFSVDKSVKLIGIPQRCISNLGIWAFWAKVLTTPAWFLIFTFLMWGFSAGSNIVLTLLLKESLNPAAAPPQLNEVMITSPAAVGSCDFGDGSGMSGCLSR